MEQFGFHQVNYVPLCAKQWLRRCASPTYLEAVDRLFLKPGANASNVFCDPPIRNEFLKYSSCLIYEVKLSSSYRKQCIKHPVPAAEEFIHEQSKKSLNLTDFIRNSCCAYVVLI